MIKMQKLINATDTFRELAVIYVAIVCLCGGLFALVEHKAFFDSIWWAFVTAMTVGYGDIYPVTIAGRIIGIILMHVVPLFIAPLIAVRMLSNMMIDHDKFTNEEQEQIKSDLAEIKNALIK